jgi:hypothetical protein
LREGQPSHEVQITGTKNALWKAFLDTSTLHDAQIDLLTGIYNFIDENQAFRQCINPHAKRFEVKYKKYSPAMLEGFTDRCLTLEELLMWRVPR